MAEIALSLMDLFRRLPDDHLDAALNVIRSLPICNFLLDSFVKVCHMTMNDS